MTGLRGRLPGVYFPDELRRLDQALRASAQPGDTDVDRQTKALYLLSDRAVLPPELEVLPIVSRLRAIGMAAGLDLAQADRVVERTLLAALADLDAVDEHPDVDHWLETLFRSYLGARNGPSGPTAPGRSIPAQTSCGVCLSQSRHR